jgi:predicted ArsR family transcriptional regulator
MGLLKAVEERLLRELAQAGSLTTDELARRLDAQHWAELSTALDQLVSSGYVSVVGPLGRPGTRYRIHSRGHAALIADP